MNPYTSFPDCEIRGGGKVADAFRAMGIHRFLEACRHVHGLPYGYNSDRDDPMTLFKERMGSCTTERATIATAGPGAGPPGRPRASASTP